MSYRAKYPPTVRILQRIFRVVKTMPESRLAVVCVWTISFYILTLVLLGDVRGWVGVGTVGLMNTGLGGFLYAVGSALDKVEENQKKP